MFDSKEQFVLSVSSNNTVFTAQVSVDPENNATSRIWTAIGSPLNNTVTFRMRQSDKNLSVGTFYYVTVFANQSLSNITIKLD